MIPVELGVLLLTVAAPTSGRVEVSWRAPADCPGPPALVDRVEALLGRGLDGVFDRGLDVAVTATTTAGGFAVRIQTTDDEGRVGDRRIEGETCDEVLEAAALVVAIAIDPAAITWQAEPEPEPTKPRVDPAARPALETSTTSASLPPVSEDGLRAPDIPFGISLPRLDFRAGLRAGAGVLPEQGLGLSFGGAVLWSPLRFQAAGTVWFDRDVPAPGAVATVGLWSFEGEGCYEVTLGRYFEVPICLGLELGRFAADSIDEMTAPARELWVASTAATGLAIVPIRQLAFIIEAEGVLSWLRPAYEGLPDPELVRIGRAGIRGGVWVELRVP